VEKYGSSYLVVMTLACLLSSSCHLEKKPALIEVRERDSNGQCIYTEIPFNPGKTAIVVVDMWNMGGCGYFDPDSSFVGTMEGFLYADYVSKHINVLLASARALGITVIHAPSDQTSFYENHQVRLNVNKLAEADFPWDVKPIWNDDQKKIPWAEWDGEYDYMYPGMDWKRNRPGTQPFGQNPNIVLGKDDFMTDDPEELWKIIQARGLESIIYVGGSTNMCLAGRPFGLLNMKEYGIHVYLDRNYSHVIHRIPHGWNGDVNNPAYGPQYTNRQNSKKVIRYYEQHICPTLDGEDLIKMARMNDLPVKVLQPKLEQSYGSIRDVCVSFQPQHIEVPECVVLDHGLAFAEQPCGLFYGWQDLKVKDTYRTGYDGLGEAGMHAFQNDLWSIALPKGNYTIMTSGNNSGKIKIQDKNIKVGADHDPWTAEVDISNESSLIKVMILADQIDFHYIRITLIPDEP
jgi:hypothetical protein